MAVAPVCHRRTARWLPNQIQMRRVILKRAQRYLNIKYGEVSLQIESAALPPKPQPLYEMKMKR